MQSYQKVKVKPILLLLVVVVVFVVVVVWGGGGGGGGACKRKWGLELSAHAPFSSKKVADDS